MSTSGSVSGGSSVTARLPEEARSATRPASSSRTSTERPVLSDAAAGAGVDHPGGLDDGVAGREVAGGLLAGAADEVDPDDVAGARAGWWCGG